MSKNSKRHTRTSQTDEDNTTCTVSICRGGECGSRTKHPGTDHRAQLRLITDKLADHAVITITKCLDACEHSNVIVVTPSNQGQRAAADEIWLGEMNDQPTTRELIGWVQEGGPGVAEMPLALELVSFKPSRRMRRALED